jgi:hypothetical protein
MFPPLLRRRSLCVVGRRPSSMASENGEFRDVTEGVGRFRKESGHLAGRQAAAKVDADCRDSVVRDIVLQVFSKTLGKMG